MAATNTTSLDSAFQKTRAGSRAQLVSKAAAVLDAKEAKGVQGKDAAQQEDFDIEDEELVEKKLREFDLTAKYGPLSGLTRVERYERAVAMGLDPPSWIKHVLHRYGEGSDINKHLFSSGKI